ncbi:MAG: exodeoxyribonuclease VII small subunit [Oscillospiraceae bacterium]
MSTESFDKSMARLEEISLILQKGECPLENAMELFKEGMDLSRLCSEKLQTARQMVLNLSEVQENEE